jgi:hypothetical protein
MLKVSPRYTAAIRWPGGNPRRMPSGLHSSSRSLMNVEHSRFSAFQLSTFQQACRNIIAWLPEVYVSTMWLAEWCKRNRVE